MKAATYPRLSARTLAHIKGNLRVPQYRRDELKTGVVHLGVGAFHRCHQAEYLDDVAEAGLGVGLAGINLAPPDIASVLAAQDGLYTRTLAEGEAREVRVIGVFTELLDNSTQPERCRALIADPAVTTVTMTVTEKGYCHVPATGLLDAGNAAVLRDLTGFPGAPGSVPGFLVAGLAQRRRRGAGPINLISCDNIAGNGQVLRNVVTGLAALSDPDLAGWIEANVAFPSTMVDRIVPASTADDIRRLELALGLSDKGAVLGEPFRQWVIEDSFLAARPAWELAGAEIVRDVAPYEQVKMRVLNATQTILALLGAAKGHEFTAEAVRDTHLAAFTMQVLTRETLPNLPIVAGMAAGAYLAQSIERVRNVALRHRCHQIATDTSQKIRQRLLDPLRLCRARGQPAAGLETAIAAWVAYLAAAQPAFGARWVASDPVADAARAIAATSGRDLGAFARGILGLAPIFGRDLSQDGAFAARVSARVTDLMAGMAPLAVAGYEA
jgi:fructuronate reductase